MPKDYLHCKAASLGVRRPILLFRGQKLVFKAKTYRHAAVPFHPDAQNQPGKKPSCQPWEAFCAYKLGKKLRPFVPYGVVLPIIWGLLGGV